MTTSFSFSLSTPFQAHEYSCAEDQGVELADVPTVPKTFELKLGVTEIHGPPAPGNGREIQNDETTREIQTPEEEEEELVFVKFEDEDEQCITLD